MRIKFFCNLERTYISNEDEEKRNNLLHEFIELIEKLSDNYIEFSFLSNTNMENLMNFINELQTILNHKKAHIQLGFQYTENKSYRNGIIDNAFPGALSQMSLDVYKKDFDKIFYADKSTLANEMAEQTLKEMSPNSEVVILNCIDDGPSPLYALNAALKNYLGISRKRVGSEN